MKKILILSAFAIITFSCADKKVKTSGVDGRKVFKQNCVVCHGLDGKPEQIEAVAEYTLKLK